MKSIKIDNHKEPGQWFWSISDINRLIIIDVYRFWSGIGIIDVLRPVNKEQKRDDCLCNVIIMACINNAWRFVLKSCFVGRAAKKTHCFFLALTARAIRTADGFLEWIAWAIRTADEFLEQIARAVRTADYFFRTDSLGRLNGWWVFLNG